MALNTFKCNCLTLLHFKGLTVISIWTDYLCSTTFLSRMAVQDDLMRRAYTTESKCCVFSLQTSTVIQTNVISVRSCKDRNAKTRTKVNTRATRSRPQFARFTRSNKCESSAVCLWRPATIICETVDLMTSWQFFCLRHR